MTLTQLFAMLAPFEALLKPGVQTLDAEAIAEMNTLIAGIQSPFLKELATAVAGALEAVAQTEIAKL